MSNVTKICLTAAAVLLVSGVLFLAAVDVPVKKNQVVATISNDRFFKKD